MRIKPVALPLTSLLLVLLLAGCTDEAPDGGSAQARMSTTPTPTPSLGGPRPHRHRPPDAPMDRLERPVAKRLARQVAREGLSLTYLDCPDWDGDMPRTLTCRGFVDGVVARVRVRLQAPLQGTAVSFDARLAGGVIATSTLEHTLREQHLSRPDCGPVPAYPARVGLRVVCRAVRAGTTRYLVATVRDRRGGVTISDYHGATTDNG